MAHSRSSMTIWWMNGWVNGELVISREWHPNISYNKRLSWTNIIPASNNLREKWICLLLQFPNRLLNWVLFLKTWRIKWIMNEPKISRSWICAVKSKKQISPHFFFPILCVSQLLKGGLKLNQLNQQVFTEHWLVIRFTHTVWKR